jgi:hypothetical protein
MAQLLLYFIYRNAPPIVAQQLELNEADTPTETQPPSMHIISTDCDYDNSSQSDHSICMGFPKEVPNWSIN